MTCTAGLCQKYIQCSLTENSRINQKQNAPMLFFFYNDWNTDVYWQISQLLLYLEDCIINKLLFNWSAFGHLCQLYIVGIITRFVQRARYSTALYTVVEAGKIGISPFMSGIPTGNQSLLASYLRLFQ